MSQSPKTATNQSQNQTTGEDGNPVLTQLDPGKLHLCAPKPRVQNAKQMLSSKRIKARVSRLKPVAIAGQVIVEFSARAQHGDISSKAEKPSPNAAQDLPLNDAIFTDLLRHARCSTPSAMMIRAVVYDTGNAQVIDASNFVWTHNNRSDRNANVGASLIQSENSRSKLQRIPV